MEDMDKKKELIRLVQQIVPSQMKHHAEAEACDLLMEVSVPFLCTECVQCLTRWGLKTKFTRNSWNTSCTK